MRPHGSPGQLEQRRNRAIELLEQGYQPVDVASMLGVDRRSVRRWKAAYRENGQEGINRKPAPGRPCKLGEKARQELERRLLKGAKAAGFPTDLWTCPRVARLISARFGVTYHVDHIGRLLRSLGWSPQRPQRRAAERNEEAIQGWIKEQWPRIKKTSRLRAWLVFLDESGMLMAPHVRRSWAPRGQTPIMYQRTRAHQKVSVIADLGLLR
ncbi:IS630 family transposase [Candidatus Hydrogenedentota bacterium]